LREQLRSPNLYIRDAAVAGLSFMGDAASLADLVKSYESENAPRLKKFMKKIIEEITKKNNV
jgi:HEAT repeat protein